MDLGSSPRPDPDPDGSVRWPQKTRKHRRGDLRFHCCVLLFSKCQPGDHSRTIRYHSPRYVVDLIKHAHKTYNIDFIGFLDENLMTMDQYSKRTWMKEICERLIDEGLAPTCVRDGVDHNIRCDSWTART